MQSDFIEKIIPEHMRSTLGEVDHRKVVAPYVRISNVTTTPHDDYVLTFDIRFTQPNVEFIDAASMHSLEHMLHVFLERRLTGFINFQN